MVCWYHRFFRTIASRMNTLKHLAFIPDGNMRWARRNNVSAIEGYHAGLTTVERLAAHAIDLGIPYLSFYLLSLENLRGRSQSWNDSFFDFARRMRPNLFTNPIFSKTQVRILGDTNQLPDYFQKELEKITVPKPDCKTTLAIAVAYTGRDEIMRAIQRYYAQHVGQPSAPLTEESFSNHLDSAGMPDPDLLIRSGDTHRLSGFLPWQLTYTELRFLPDLWPDLTTETVDAVIADFQTCRRNHGRERDFAS